jgi:hypothetical protein
MAGCLFMSGRHRGVDRLDHPGMPGAFTALLDAGLSADACCEPWGLSLLHTVVLLLAQLHGNRAPWWVPQPTASQHLPGVLRVLLERGAVLQYFHVWALLPSQNEVAIRMTVDHAVRHGILGGPGTLSDLLVEAAVHGGVGVFTLLDAGAPTE